MNWSDPDHWIGKRLAGENQGLAKKLWKVGLNPRYTEGELDLARVHGLLSTDSGVFAWTPRGQAFDQGSQQVIRDIDEEEGVIQMLSVLATLGAAPRRDIVEPWRQALTPGGDSRSVNTMSSKLYDRLVNALERGLVDRMGTKYELTAQGQAYVSAVEQPQNSAKVTLDADLHKYRNEQRQRLHKLLSI